MQVACPLLSTVTSKDQMRSLSPAGRPSQHSKGRLRVPRPEGSLPRRPEARVPALRYGLAPRSKPKQGGSRTGAIQGMSLTLKRWRPMLPPIIPLIPPTAKDESRFPGLRPFAVLILARAFLCTRLKRPTSRPLEQGLGKGQACLGKDQSFRGFSCVRLNKARKAESDARR